MATKTYGGVTAEQLKSWKEKYDVSEVWVKNRAGKIVGGYVRNPNRDEICIIVDKQAAGKVFESKEFFAKNCWLGGDEECITDEQTAISFAIASAAAVAFLETGIKKL